MHIGLSSISSWKHELEFVITIIVNMSKSQLKCGFFWILFLRILMGHEVQNMMPCVGQSIIRLWTLCGYELGWLWQWDYAHPKLHNSFLSLGRRQPCMAWKLGFGPSHLSPWHFICCCFLVFHQSGGELIHNFDECQVLPIPIIKHEPMVR